MSTVVLAAGKAAAKPYIDWSALGKVAGVSLVFAVAIVVIFSVGVIGLSMARGGADEPSGDGVALPANRVLGSVLAGTCFVTSAGAVVYGISLIVPQFH